MIEIDPGLSEQELCKVIRDWLDENLPEGWQGSDSVEPPALADWFVRLGDSGLAAPSWPVEHGGLGLNAAGAAVASDEAARRDAGRPEEDFVGLALAGPTVLTWGTEEQKQRYLPPLLRGQERWCQLFSEPDAGSDLAALATKAVQREDGCWVVNGQKVWSSFAHLSDFGILMARSDQDLPKHEGITYFLLDMRTPGVEVRPLRQMTGNAEFNEVFLTDVVIPDDCRLGPVNAGWRVGITTLMSERSGLSGRPRVGAGRVDQLVRRARQLDRWQDAVLRDRLMRALVAERALQMTTLRAYAEAKQAAPGAEGSIRKLANAVLVEELGRLATDVEPSNALAWAPGSREGQAAEQLLASKTFSIAGGTSEIQRNIIAERLLGLPREVDADRHRPFRSRGGRS